MSTLSIALRNAALGFTLALATLASATSPAIADSPLGTPPASTASYDAGIIHVDAYGHGPQNIVLIPGLASGPWTWYGTIDHLLAGNGDATYTIYALTLPGFDGRRPTAKRPLFDAFSTDFWALLDAKHIVQPVVVGHSLGGTLAIALAEQHPDRLAGIMAVDGLPVFPMLAGATPDKRATTGAQMAAMYTTMDSAKELAGMTAYMSSVGTNKPGLVDPVAQLQAKSDAPSVGAWAQEDVQGDLRPGLAQITIPFVEIMPYNPADSKPPTSYTQEQVQAFYQALIAGAPKGKVVAITPSRHYAMLDQPEQFYAALTQFLGSLH